MGALTTGFNAGMSLADSILGDRRRRERDERDKREYERRARLDELRLRDAERQAKDAEELRSAAQAPRAAAGFEQQAAGGGALFTQNAAARRLIEQQNADIAEMTDGAVQAAPMRQSYRAGDMIVRDKAQADKMANTDGPLDAERRVASTLRNQGKIDQANKIEQFIRAQQAEGTDKMFDAIIAGGDGEAAKQAYNQHGADRLGAEDSINVLRRYTLDVPGAGSIPTADVELTVRGKKRVIKNVAWERFNLSEKALELAKAKRGDDRQVKEDARTAAKDSLDAEVKRAQIRASDALAKYRRDASKAALTAAHSKAVKAGGDALDFKYDDKDREKDYKNMAAIAAEASGLDEIPGTPEEQAALQSKATALQNSMFEMHTNALRTGVRLMPEEALMATQQVQAGNVARMGDWIVTVLPSGRTVPVRRYAEPLPADAAQPKNGQKKLGPRQAAVEAETEQLRSVYPSYGEQGVPSAAREQLRDVRSRMSAPGVRPAP